MKEIRELAGLVGCPVVDLGLGTPVDPTPMVAQVALATSADAPGYPTTGGSEAIRSACSRWICRTLGAEVPPTSVIPTIGSKEMIVSLPRSLGLRDRSRIAIPKVAYPSYGVGGVLAGAEVIATDRPEEAKDVDLVWLNSPRNPTGAVMPAERLAEIISWARANDVVVASDECYIEFGWEADPISILHPSVNGGSLVGLLAVHSLSKRSNLAGYRIGFISGDERLIRDLLAIRKHEGRIVPSPLQASAVAVLGDDRHVMEQKKRYGARRTILRTALLSAGFKIDCSEAGLYLWATRGQPCLDEARWFTDRGIVVTPGHIYGPSAANHVRLALTATDGAIAAAAERIGT